MPNISFDIFYSTDIINFTASRSGAAPRAKPSWKVRQAPKLGPKQTPTPASVFGNRVLHESQGNKAIESSRPEVEEIESEESDRTPAANKKKLTSSIGEKAKEQKEKSGSAGAHTAPNSTRKKNTKPAPKLNKAVNDRGKTSPPKSSGASA